VAGLKKRRLHSNGPGARIAFQQNATLPHHLLPHGNRLAVSELVRMLAIQLHSASQSPSEGANESHENERHQTHDSVSVSHSHAKILGGRTLMVTASHATPERLGRTNL